MTDFYDFEIHYTHMWYKELGVIWGKQHIDLELSDLSNNKY